MLSKYVACIFFTLCNSADCVGNRRVILSSVCGAEQGKGREMKADKRMTVVENQELG